MKTRLTSLPSRQHGATLIVVLLLLLVMTLLALASLRGTLLEERMGANQFDRSLSFQAAEAALRAGEAFAATRPVLPASGCAAGLCAEPDPAAAAVWTSATVWAGAPSITVTSGNLSVQPQYVVELLADNVPAKGACTTDGDLSETSCTGSERRYRITARSQPAGRAEVLLQSIYAVP
jgi:type IV pilus assembly protein PilX